MIRRRLHFLQFMRKTVLLLRAESVKAWLFHNTLNYMIVLSDMYGIHVLFFKENNFFLRVVTVVVHSISNMMWRGYDSPRPITSSLFSAVSHSSLENSQKSTVLDVPCHPRSFEDQFMESKLRKELARAQMKLGKNDRDGYGTFFAHDTETRRENPSSSCNKAKEVEKEID